MRLWRNNPEFPGCKYLVLRRDGTIPEWPLLVLGAGDEAAAHALTAYAHKAAELGWDPEYVADIHALAEEFHQWRATHGDGDPDAPRHRQDNPEIIKLMTKGH